MPLSSHVRAYCDSVRCLHFLPVRLRRVQRDHADDPLCVHHGCGSDHATGHHDRQRAHVNFKKKSSPPLRGWPFLRVYTAVPRSRLISSYAVGKIHTALSCFAYSRLHFCLPLAFTSAYLSRSSCSLPSVPSSRALS